MADLFQARGALRGRDRTVGRLRQQRSSRGDAVRCDDDGNTKADLGYTWSRPTIARIRVDSALDGGLVDKYVAVFGGGTIGQFCVQSALAAGAGEVFLVEPLPARRQLALDFGASATIDPNREDVTDVLRRLTGGIGPDLVLEASGKAVAPAIHAARKGGRIVLVGLPVKATSFNFFDLVSTEKEVIGSLSHIYDEDYAAAVRWLGDGRVLAEPLISARLPLDALVSEGLHRLENAPGETLKVIIRS